MLYQLLQHTNMSHDQIVQFQFYIVKIGYLVRLLHNWINEYIPEEQDEETVNIKLPSELIVFTMSS